MALKRRKRTHASSITVGDLTSELRLISKWIDGTRKVMAAVRPQDKILIRRDISWEPGGPYPPPRAYPKCDCPKVLRTVEVRASDMKKVLRALRDWTASIAWTLDGLPGDTPVKPPSVRRRPR